MFLFLAGQASLVLVGSVRSFRSVDSFVPFVCLTHLGGVYLRRGALSSVS